MCDLGPEGEPRIALRADMDALPITEETGLPVFVSEEPLNAVAKGTGVMLQEDSIWTT